MRASVFGHDDLTSSCYTEWCW